MRRRLYFVLPNLSSARKVAEDLLLALIEQRHMRFLARRDMALGDLHEAGRLQKTDQLHAAFLGMMLAGLLGAAIGIGLFVVKPEGLPVNHSVILGMTLFGAVFGFWVGSMVGASAPNSKLRQFNDDMESGRILLMVDVPRTRLEEIRDLVTLRHPEATARGRDPTMPAFP